MAYDNDNDESLAERIMYYLPYPWYEYTRKPDEAIYVHTCRHSRVLRKTSTVTSLLLPNEILDKIRLHIDDAETLCAYDKALRIPRCRHMFCLRLGEQHLMESRYDTLSFGEVEHNKVIYQPHTLFRNDPPFYVLQFANDSIRVYALKRHQRGYLFNNADPIFTDPVSLSQSFSTFTMYIAYDPAVMTGPLQITKETKRLMSPVYRRVYRAIQKWISKPEEVHYAYPGYEGFGLQHRGRIWIYPSSRCYQPTFGLSFSEHIQTPCREWVEYLYLLSKFQKKHSTILKKLYLVS